MPAAAIGPAIGAVGSLLGGVIGSGASNQAAGVLAGTMGANANQLIGVGEQQLKGQLNNLNPYILRGTNAVSDLASMSRPGGPLLTPYQSFSAPTGVNYQNDPGYQFRMQQGVQALQNSAAARGDLLSGNTLQSLLQLGQGLGSEEYQNVYNRALSSYGTNAQNYYTGQQNTYQRLMGLGSMGLQATGMADQARQAYQGLYGGAMNMSNQGAGAQAAGIMGSANQWQNALGGATGFGMNLASLLNTPTPQAAPVTSGYGAMPGASPFGLMAPPTGDAAYGLGSSVTGGGWGIGGYGQGFPAYNQSGYKPL